MGHGTRNTNIPTVGEHFGQLFGLLNSVSWCQFPTEYHVDPPESLQQHILFPALGSQKDLL